MSRIGVPVTKHGRFGAAPAERPAGRLERDGERGGEPRGRADARPGMTLPSHSTTGMPQRRRGHQDRDRDVAAGREDRGRAARAARIAAACGTETPSRIGSRTAWTSASVVRSERAASRRSGMPAAGTRVASRPRWPPSQRSSGASGRWRGATGRRREPGRCVRPSRRPRSAGASSFHVPLSTVSREIDSRIPTAAKLMMSDEPPALMNGSVIPVIGSSATTTPMLMNAWRHSQAVIPAASSAPNVSGAAERDPDAGVRQQQEQRDHDDRADQPELLADVAKMKSLKALGRKTWLSPRPVPKMPPRPSASRPWIVWKPVAQAVEPRVLPDADALELVALQADRRASPGRRARASDRRGGRGSRRRRRTS